MDNPNSLRLLETQAFHYPKEQIDAIDNLCEQALRYLYIKARVAPKLLNDDDVLTNISKFVRHSRHTFCYILLDEPDWLMKDDSALLRLSRRLSEKIVIKQFDHDSDDDFGCVILNDVSSMIYLPSDPHQLGFVCDTDRPNQKKLRDQFIRQWQQASVATSLRSLSGL